MRTRLLFPIAVAAMSLGACSASDETQQKDFTQYVNPFIGTDFTGNTYPGAQVPFGMVQLSPDNGIGGWDRIAGYFYPDSTIAGFSHTHLSGTGAGDLYDISFMPVTLPWVQEPNPIGIHSKFSHDSESATAGYYKVTLADSDIDVELTATDRAGLQRYTFPSDSAAVVLDLAKAMNWDATVDTHIDVIDSVNIAGYRFSDGWARNQKVYFATRFSKPFRSLKIDSAQLSNGGCGLVATFDFATAPEEQIVVSTALSPTSVEAARANLVAEVPDDDFDKYRELARDKWNEELGRVKVESEDADLLTKFYTALYHSMLAPTLYDNADGTYLGPDGEVHKADGWNNYSTFSTWDTYRAAHPLYTIVDPRRASDMVTSLVEFAKQNGRLPVWNMWASETDMMIGYHSAPIIADAILKGISRVDPKEALEVSVATANMDDYRGLGYFKTLGYVPYDAPETKDTDDWSMSKTIEYAYDDYAIARLASAIGEDEVAKEFMGRSRNYKNVFNPATGFMQPRSMSGEFIEGFKAEDYTPHICESNAWHYLWSVQHEPDSLMALMGGKEVFGGMLDSMFTYKADEEALPIFSTGMIGQYAHGNEPSHHVAYLYNVAGEPAKGAKYLREIMDNLYLNTPAGLSGNEDCGQMSAWYVFSAMGFYPVNPVGGEYEIGTPLFKKVEIPVVEGKTFTLSAPGLSDENIYVKSVKVNGEPYAKSFITHDQIMSGATVELEMSSQPEPAWY